ncbi:dihydrodipicolinate reductase [Acidobacteria bacterium AH-259-O06]|nr:dihydrodipicolinate reductase [Acidobacteria bacterium AH-259-O06]
MRVTLIGHGKMGRMVEKVARDRGHEIVHILNSQNHPPGSEFSGEWVKITDTLIDFSVANAVHSNVEGALRAKIPIVVGTTGWTEHLDKIRTIVEADQGACIYSSNFSMGVQVLFYLTRRAGELLSRFQDFHPFVVESHHAHKVDAPSGTALTLRRILEESYRSNISVSSLRAGFFPGNHTVGFDSLFETLTLEHTARSRESFAGGALFAAQWLQDKTGFYSFEEILFGEEHD